MKMLIALLLAVAYFAWDKCMNVPAQAPERSAAVTAPAASGGQVPATRAGAGFPAESVAVLPFATRSDQQVDAYFSEGVHDDLLTQLAKIGDLKVISRTSVMQYAHSTKPVREIAAELGVATVLEGGIQRAGDRVRINAQLIDAGTDTHLWAETWDEELTASNVFEIQSELATLIATALKTELAPELQARIEDKPTESLAAYDLALRGRYLMDKEMPQENLEGAAALFRQAIVADPSYAAAWSGLSQALLEQVGWVYRDESDFLPEAWQAAEKAIAILEHAEERRFSAVEIALVYSKLGDNDQAFAFMDRAFAESPAGLYYIAADPGADAMRSDPRWQDLLDRLTQAQR